MHTYQIMCLHVEIVNSHVEIISPRVDHLQAASSHVNQCLVRVHTWEEQVIGVSSLVGGECQCLAEFTRGRPIHTWEEQVIGANLCA